MGFAAIEDVGAGGVRVNGIWGGGWGGVGGIWLLLRQQRNRVVGHCLDNAGVSS